MSGRFRKIIFWLHLLAGVIAGVVILIMSLTGAALAFEKEIIAWADGESRIITPPANGERLSFDELFARVREEKPGERPSSITIESDATHAVLVAFGRNNSFYANPFTGEIREPSGKRVRAFMQIMLTWHRYLGAGEEHRATGKAITGACNAAFLFLAVSGLYLWWPRQWTKNSLRAIAVINFKLRGKARDWNWHNAIGVCCAPVLIALTATALPISYRSVSDAIYKIAGSPIPAAGAVRGGAPTAEISAPTPNARPLNYDALIAAVEKESPNWKQITFQTGSRGSNEVREGNRERSERKVEERRAAAQPVNVAVKHADQWPLFSSTQLTLDPFTGEILRKETFGNLTLGRKIRSWTRFLHTGEALGIAGKAVAACASAAAALLFWTGFALAWRRFFGPKNRANLESLPDFKTPLAQTAAKE